jgi:hypothetical protein
VDDKSFWASAGRVVRRDDEGGTIDYEVDEARAMLAELTAAIAEAEQQAIRIAAACADGHDWGEPYNAWHFWPDTKVCVRYCRRDGCHEREELPGWVEFAGQLHHDPVTGRRIECTGPGCDACEMRKLGGEMRRIFADGFAALDRAVLGSAFQREATDG